MIPTTIKQGQVVKKNHGIVIVERDVVDIARSFYVKEKLGNTKLCTTGYKFLNRTGLSALCFL